MAINFDSLPSENPNGRLLPAGPYKIKIVEAKMLDSKSSNNTYLALTYQLTNTDGVACGKLWDNFFDSDKELLRYKLSRLITALGIKLSGSFELKDLAKIVVNKEMVGYIGTDAKATPPRNTIDVFKDEIFYPVSEWATFTGADVDDMFTEEVSASDAVDEADESVDEGDDY